MEQKYFEQRAMFGGMAPGMGMFDGYRKGESYVSVHAPELNASAETDP